MHLELYRNLDGAIARIVSDGLDIGLEVLEHRRVLFGFEPCGFEICGQPYLENVLRFVRRTKRLGVGTRERDEPWLEALPNAGIGVALPQLPNGKPRNTLEVWQRRHVHDRQARYACRRDTSHQLPNTFRAVLGFLHAKHDQIELPGVDVVWRGGGKLAPPSPSRLEPL